MDLQIICIGQFCIDIMTKWIFGGLNGANKDVKVNNVPCSTLKKQSVYIILFQLIYISGVTLAHLPFIIQ